MTIVRKATLEDMDDMLVMAEEFVEANPYTVPYDEDSCRELMANVIENIPEENAILFVGEEEGKVVGMFCGLRAPIFWNKNYYQSAEYWWWVTPKYRNAKVGKALFRAYEDWADHYGVHQKTACTMRNNKDLISWFEKEGYTNYEFYCAKES